MTVIDRPLTASPAAATATDRTARLSTVLANGADPPTVRLEGEIDLASEDALRRALGAALATASEADATTSRSRGLVLDVSGLDFCSLGGVGILMDTVEAGRSVAVPVTITGASATVERILRILAGRPAV